MHRPIQPADPQHGRDAVARWLIVMRHAKAENQAGSGGGDRLRRLTRRGRDQAAHMGHGLADVISEAGARAPDLILASSALRTRETAELVMVGLGISELMLEDGMYGAGTDEAMDYLRTLDDDAVSALLVGHNPTVHDLVLTLGGLEASELPEFPPAAAALLSLESSGWSAIGPSSCRLLSVHLP